MSRTRFTYCKGCESNGSRTFFKSDLDGCNVCGWSPYREQPNTLFSIGGFDPDKIRVMDKGPRFHNGLNEYLPSGASRSYVEKRARAKGLRITWDTTTPMRKRAVG